MPPSRESLSDRRPEAFNCFPDPNMGSARAGVFAPNSLKSLTLNLSSEGVALAIRCLREDVPGPEAAVRRLPKKGDSSRVGRAL